MQTVSYLARIMLAFAVSACCGCDTHDSGNTDQEAHSSSIDSEFLAAVDLSKSPAAVQELVNAASRGNINGMSASEFKDAWSHFDAMPGNDGTIQCLSYHPERSPAAQKALELAIKNRMITRTPWIFVRILDGKIDDFQGIMQGF